jgi:hypothetical protein
MAVELTVMQEDSSGLWLVREGDQVIAKFPRLEDAVAHARAVLLQRDKGEMVVYTPSGRPRERLNLHETGGHKVVQPA